MTVAEDEVEQITQWARRSAPSERGRLLTELARAVPADRLATSPRACAVVGELCDGALAAADPEARRTVATWASTAAWLPASAAQQLARDDIEIARPVIARSPALSESDQLSLAEGAGAEHAAALGRRADLSDVVTDAILARGDGAAAVSLATNERALLAPGQLERLIALAARTPALRTALARRGELTPELARELWALSGSEVRRTLANRFGPLNAPARTASDASESRLVEKLARGGELSAGYALRVLRQGELGLFIHAVAKLGRRQVEEVRGAVGADTATELARVSAAAGIDRSVFPVVLDAVRAVNAGRPGRGGETRAELDRLFPVEAPPAPLASEVAV